MKPQQIHLQQLHLIELQKQRLQRQLLHKERIFKNTTTTYRSSRRSRQYLSSRLKVITINS